MLDGLDDVPWEDLSHAYGAAGDVPALLRALAGPDASDRDDALYALYGNLYHQGSLYPATVPAIPFLVELATAPAVAEREQVLRYLAHIGRSALWADEVGDDGSEHGRAFRGCAEALAACGAALCACLGDEDEAIRVAAAFALANAGGQTEALARSVSRAAGLERALILYALVAGRDPPAASHVAPFTEDDAPLLRLAARIGLHRAGGPSPHIEADDYVQLAEVVEATASGALRQPVELLALDDDGVLRGLASALARLRDPGTALTLGQRLLEARFPSDGPWDDVQRAILTGVAQSDGFWRFNGNAMLALSSAGVSDNRTWFLEELGIERRTEVVLLTARGRAAASAVCEEEGHPEWIDAVWVLFSGDTDALDEQIVEDPADFPPAVMDSARRVAETLLPDAIDAGYDVDEFRFYSGYSVEQLAGLAVGNGWAVHVLREPQEDRE